MSLIVFFITVAVVILMVVLFLKLTPQTGARANGARLERMQKSPNYRDGIFVNPVPTSMNPEGISIIKGMWKFMSGGEDREPDPGRGVPASGAGAGVGLGIHPP